MTMPERPQVAHLSIHDVAPHTLGKVGQMLARLQDWKTGPAMLLLIPGLNWTEEELATVRGWQSQGHVLAGHGWLHRISSYGGWYHRLHSWTLSRDVAEHLSLSEEGIVELITRCASWFTEHGFEVPEHYVPPAWAMGRVSKNRLQALPFQTYEFFGGVYHAEQRHFYRCPLVGFEADTRLRALTCRWFNRLNLHKKSGEGPLRISLHPFDLDLFLKRDLEKVCSTIPCSPRLEFA